DLLVTIGEPLDGAQTITLGGTLGAGDLTLRAELGKGLWQLIEAPLRVVGALESTDVEGLTRQLGLGGVALFDGEGSMLVSLSLDGTPSNSLGANLTASMGE